MGAEEFFAVGGPVERCDLRFEGNETREVGGRVGGGAIDVPDTNGARVVCCGVSAR